MTTETIFDFQQFIDHKRSIVEARLKDYLQDNEPIKLWEAMRYSTVSGGKRLRALLCLSSAESINPYTVENAVEIALPCACAIELAHTMSLIHDDLPCLDNDDLRRGKPTNHKVFGEAMALLAGDGLLVFVFELLARELCEVIDSKTLLQVIEKFAKALGPSGMVGGQVEDLVLTGLANPLQSGVNTQTLESMHNKKTGALIAFSAWSGACLAGANQKQLDALEEFGKILGLAFQIADDLLDVTGDIKEIGKTPGKDKAAHKTTWVSFYGIDQTKSYLTKLQQEAQRSLDQTGIKSDSLLPLQSLLQYAINRIN